MVSAGEAIEARGGRTVREGEELLADDLDLGRSSSFESAEDERGEAFLTLDGALNDSSKGFGSR